MQIYKEAHYEQCFLVAKTYGSQYLVKIFVISDVDA